MSHTINKIVLRPDVHKAVARRSWHMWGTTMYATMILGICILIGAAWISDSLDSYCPEDTGVVFRLT
jgi:hypothetical protein